VALKPVVVKQTTAKYKGKKSKETATNTLVVSANTTKKAKLVYKAKQIL